MKHSKNGARSINGLARVLVIAADGAFAKELRIGLEAARFEAVAAGAADGLLLAEQDEFDVVLVDLGIPGFFGLEVVEEIHRDNPGLPIVLIAELDRAERAIEACRRGAYEVLHRPFELPELVRLVEQAATCNRGNAILKADPAGGSSCSMVGNSPVLHSMCKEIGRAARTSAAVMIRGETGTGKELVAQAIWQHSDRADRPFVAINCASIAESLIESELFGHERGAFTGAVERRVGWFEKADKGTLFLDEIGDLNLAMQVKLLRVLQDKGIHRVGSTVRLPVDVRIIAATHRNLETAMAEGQFREDLYYRLAALTIRVPSLAQRREDIPSLVAHFLRRVGDEVGVKHPAMQLDAVQFLQGQPWPGNVRELENVIRQSLVQARGHTIGLVCVQEVCGRWPRPEAIDTESLDGLLRQLLAKAARGQVTDVYHRIMEEVERRLFASVMRLTHGNLAEAARWLGLVRTTVRQKLRQLGAQAEQFKLPPPSLR